MTRFSRLRPVNSYKHVIDQQGGLIAAAQQNFALIDTEDNPVLANNTDVQTGSTVSSIYLKVEVYATATTALANCYLIIFKNPGNAFTIPAANAIGVSDLKKFVIHQEMVMMEKNTTGLPRTLFKGVIRIPRGYKRNGQDDALLIGLLSPGVNADFCFQCIYKEFR